MSRKGIEKRERKSEIERAQNINSNSKTKKPILAIRGKVKRKERIN